MKKLSLEVKLKNTLVEKRLNIKVGVCGPVFTDVCELRELLSKTLNSLFEEVTYISIPRGEPEYTLREVIFTKNTKLEHILCVEFHNGEHKKISIITNSEENPTIEGTCDIIQKGIVDCVDEVKKIIDKYPMVTDVKTSTIELDI